MPPQTGELGLRTIFGVFTRLKGELISHTSDLALAPVATANPSARTMRRARILGRMYAIDLIIKSYTTIKTTIAQADKQDMSNVKH